MTKGDWMRGDIVIGRDNERVYLRLERNLWTCSPNGSNWYPDDAHIDTKIEAGTAVHIGNLSDFDD